jgi:1,4-dihydroxy-2-naphthoate octaprenyltransferase
LAATSSRKELAIPAIEPDAARLGNPALRYFLATRPPFVTVTLLAGVIGLASAYASGVALHPLTAIITLIFIAVAQGGFNVLNDYYDAQSGTDGANSERIYPYTGGSRFIQNGILTPAQTLAYGIALLVATMIAGLWLTAESDTGLLLIGATGLLIGWAYSAPPIALNSRGLGEACLLIGFLIVAAGADFVQRAELAALPLEAGLSFALLVVCILYINQFPDRAADAAAGKRHLVVRLEPAQARWGYPLLAAAAYLWLIGAVIAGVLSWPALIALAPAVMTVRATRILFAHAGNPAQLAPALPMTIAAATAHGVLLTVAMVLSRML